jgi:hypothetical protein
MQIFIPTGHSYFDLAPASASPSLTIAKKNIYPSGKIIVRARAKVGSTTSVPIAGVYTGSLASLEYSVNGGAYSALSGATISGGIWSASIPGLTPGLMTVAIRWANDHTISDTTSLLLADNWAGWTDSTGVSASATVPTSGTCWAYDPAGDVWFDAIANGSMVSFWGLLLSQLCADQGGVPQTAVIHGVSGSHLLVHWARGGSNYNDFIADCLASGVDAFRGALGQITNNDMQSTSGGGTPSTATLVAGLHDTTSGIALDVPGAPPSYNWLWQLSYGTWPDGLASYRTVSDQVRQATLSARDAGYLVSVGPNATGWRWHSVAEGTGDGEHPISPTDKRVLAYRWYAAIAAIEFGRNTAAPKIVSVTYNAARTSFTFTFNRNLDTAAGTDVGGFRIVDGSGTAATITSCKVTGSRQVTATTSAAVTGTPLGSFGSSEDALDQTLPGIVVALPDTTLQSTIDVPVEPFFGVAASLFVPTMLMAPAHVGQPALATSRDLVMV